MSSSGRIAYMVCGYVVEQTCNTSFDDLEEIEVLGLLRRLSFYQYGQNVGYNI
jgi:hypothetical protein